MAVYANLSDDNDTLTLLHNTITSPTIGYGAAVVVGNTTPLSNTIVSAYLTNTIVASYTLGIENLFGRVNEDYTLFSGVTTPYSGTIMSGGHSITGTAAFYDTAMYTLTAASAALDAGVNAGVSTDFQGDPRPLEAGIDIGWDELLFPISGLSAANSSPTPLGAVTFFTATLSAGSNVTYQWNFGDGNLGSGANPTHTYTTTGNYNAIVTATNRISSASASTVVTITQSSFELFLPIVIRPASTVTTRAPDNASSDALAQVLILNVEREIWHSLLAFNKRI